MVGFITKAYEHKFQRDASVHKSAR